MSRPTSVFGYGSLVSPASMARTLGRAVAASDVVPAVLDGYGRRWNYGSLHQRGTWTGPHGDVADGVVVCLGLAASAGERCNGVVVEVDDDELALLDWRERDYDRVDVTDRIARQRADASLGRVVTYVPRPSAIERYETARDARRAAVRRSYHDLVERAFGALGAVHLADFRRATPAPDVPVLEFG